MSFWQGLAYCGQGDDTCYHTKFRYLVQYPQIELIWRNYVWFDLYINYYFFFLKFLKQPVLPFSFFLHYLFSYTLFLFKYLFLHSLSFYLSYLSFTSILFPLTHLLPIIFFLGKRTLYSLVYLLLLLHKLSF